MESEARRTRLQRAVHDVAKRYSISSQPPHDGREVYALRGGSAVWQVEVDAGGATSPRCTCPDFVHRGEGGGHACKHILAVLLGEPRMRAQAIDFFL